MPTTSTLQDRYAETMDRVAQAAAASGRTPNDVLVVAVTKYADFDDVRALHALGHRDFGESRIAQFAQRAAMMDEALRRQKAMPAVAAKRATHFGGEHLLARPGDPTEPRWHMIGHVQRNKAKKLVETGVRLVHTVDSLRIAEELQNQAVRRDVEIDVLIQINITGETQKSGCAIPAAHHLAAQIDDMFPLHVRGFMAMGPTSRDEEETRTAFRRTRELFEETRASGVGEGRFTILSMGMSGDYELAIECGANVVRLGSTIFGEHHPADDHPDEADE